MSNWSVCAVVCSCVCLLDRKQMDKLYFNMIAAKYFISNTPTTNCYPKLLASTNFFFLVSFPRFLYRFESSSTFTLIKCTTFLNIQKRHFSYPPASWARTAIDFLKRQTTATKSKKKYMSICQIKLSSHFKWISPTFVEYNYIHAAELFIFHNFWIEFQLQNF